tara:strand:+ start:348 stop:1463 length:1116 start_codon:yes stop_codon:yes gene_type:complete
VDIKNIIYISTEFPPGPGGIGSHTYNLSKNLNFYFSTHVLTVSDYASINECVLFDKKEKIYIHRFKRYKSKYFTIIKRLFDIYWHLKKYDYTHCIVSGRFALYISIFIKKIFIRTKILGVFHGSELLSKNKIATFLLYKSIKSLDSIISVSKYTEKLIPIKINNNSKHIVPNGVNIEINNLTNDCTSKIAGSPILLTVGSLTNRKGQINIIDSLPTIIKKYPNVHYHCIGLLIEKEELLFKIKKLNLEKFVTLHGYLSNNELYNIYNQADIFMMLSQNKIKFDAEGFGIAILEANCFGVPSIGSKNTGIEDAIIDNKTGRLVDPYNPNEILDSIDSIINNRNYYSKEARIWADKHNWNKIAKKYIKIIQGA